MKIFVVVEVVFNEEDWFDTETDIVEIFTSREEVVQWLQDTGWYKPHFADCFMHPDLGSQRWIHEKCIAHYVDGKVIY